MEKTKPTPAQAFAEHKERIQAERELAEHQFTLEEVQRLRAEAGTSLEAGQRWLALKPYAKASNERGDYREPWQMSPREYAEYAGVEGKPVYSLADVGDIIQSAGGNMAATANRPLARAWSAELARAQREGRLMTGPGGGNDPRPFDESEAARAQRLEGYGACMSLAVSAREKLEAALAQVRELESKQTDPDVITTYVINAAGQLAPYVRQTAGLPFDVRDTAEFHAFDQRVSEAGGLGRWKFDDQT